MSQDWIVSLERPYNYTSQEYIVDISYFRPFNYAVSAAVVPQLRIKGENDNKL
jgi:hypothetical protein